MSMLHTCCMQLICNWISVRTSIIFICVWFINRAPFAQLARFLEGCQRNRNVFCLLFRICHYHYHCYLCCCFVMKVAQCSRQYSFGVVEALSCERVCVLVSSVRTCDPVAYLKWKAPALPELKNNGLVLLINLNWKIDPFPL